MKKNEVFCCSDSCRKLAKAFHSELTIRQYRISHMKLIRLTVTSHRFHFDTVANLSNIQAILTMVCRPIFKPKMSFLNKMNKKYTNFSTIL